MTLRLTPAQAKQLGLTDKQVRQARCTPTAARWGRRSSSVDVARVFAVALHERFPGVFRPMPIYGIHWGCAHKKIGVQWGGIVPLPILEDWALIPVWWGDLHNAKDQWSERKLNAVLKRIGECIHGNV